MKLTILQALPVLLFAVVVGCVDEQPPLQAGDEVDEAELDSTDEAPASEVEIPVELTLGAADLEEDPELALAPNETQTAADTIGPAYHLFTKTGATCRDHCISHDEYIGSYLVGFSKPFYFYNNSKIYADYYVGASRKQKWEQHRFARANVDVYCGSSGQYLYKYYGRAKRGREVVRTYICYAGRCRFQGDNVGDFHKGWKH
jgi:hypothetical protein